MSRGRRWRRALALLLALAVPAVPGCTYLRHRALDLEQSVHYGVGGSVMPGALARVHVAPLGATVGLVSESHWVGGDFGYARRWILRASGLGLFGRLSREVDRGQSSYDMSIGDHTYVSCLEFLGWHVRERDRRLGSTLFAFGQVEVDAHALFVGLSLGLDLTQLADFLTGWFGLDLLADDGVDHAPPPEDAEETAPPPAPGEEPPR